MMENIAWAIDGGITSTSLGRMLAYQATGGEEGVAGIGDFVVRQTSVASGQVRIGSGGGVLINRYPGVKNESYMCRAGDETLLSVPQNAGTSTRYDLIVARIDDWNMPGGQARPATLPTDEVATARFEVITNVPATTKRAKELNLNYPAIALCRVAIPAGTAAITQAMLTDLREKAVPRRKRDYRVIAQGTGRNNYLTDTNFEQFPNDGAFMVEIPEWASRVRYTSNLGGFYIPAGKGYADIWVRFGNGRSDMISGQPTRVDDDATAGRRRTAMTGDDIPVPAGWRGQTIQVLLMGRKLGGTAELFADDAMAMSLDMEFIEAATEDL